MNRFLRTLSSPVRSVVPGLLALGLSVVGVSASAVVTASVAQADGGKVAVVDIQRAVMQTEDGLRAAATLKKTFDAKQVELNKRQDDLRRQQEDIQKQERVLSKEAIQKKKEDWQRQAIELQSVFVEYNKQLEGEQKKATDPIFEKMLGIVKRLAAQDGYDLVLDKNSTAYARSELDLTDRCIQSYNGGAAPANPAPVTTGAPKPAPKK